MQKICSWNSSDEVVFWLESPWYTRRNWEKVVDLLTLDKLADAHKKVIKLDTSLKIIKIKGEPMVVWFVVCTFENAEYLQKLDI